MIVNMVRKPHITLSKQIVLYSCKNHATIKHKSYAWNTSLGNITQELTRKHTWEQLHPESKGFYSREFMFSFDNSSNSRLHFPNDKKNYICIYIYIYLCTIQSCNSTRHKIYFTQLQVNLCLQQWKWIFLGKLLHVLRFALYMDMKQCLHSIINSSYYLSLPFTSKSSFVVQKSILKGMI